MKSHSQPKQLSNLSVWRNHQQTPGPTCRLSKPVFLADPRSLPFQQALSGLVAEVGALGLEKSLLQHSRQVFTVLNTLGQPVPMRDISTICVKFGRLWVLHLIILILRIFFCTFQILLLDCICTFYWLTLLFYLRISLYYIWGGPSLAEYRWDPPISHQVLVVTSTSNHQSDPLRQTYPSWRSSHFRKNPTFGAHVNLVHYIWLHGGGEGR